jgi:hypothetical protein
MAVKLKCGSIFLHIPKTGGKWVTEALSAAGLVDRQVGHIHSDFDQSLAGWKVRDQLEGLMHYIPRRALNRPESRPYRFCFVRHPLRWYESYWRYMQARGWNAWGAVNSRRHWHPNAVLNGLGSGDFNEFVSNVVDVRPGYVSELFFSYAKPGIDFVGRTETLVDDLVATLRAQRLDFDESQIRGLAKINVSPPANGAISWDPLLEETVVRLELPALLHFGYLQPELARDLGVRKPIQTACALFTSAERHEESLPGSS